MPCSIQYLSNMHACQFLRPPNTDLMACISSTSSNSSSPEWWNGGLVGVFASFLLSLTTWGFSTAFGAFQSYYQSDLLHTNSHTIYPVTIIDITHLLATSSTYDHRVWRTGLPVRSAVLKPHAGRLVVGWVTTSESRLLYVFGLHVFTYL
ncbi:uncharacterized protein ACLA_004300 [Aspergillus clavatus NRRL 1]|uniref:Uncharacterized protein n=1 Tax=Aspergillus clavatus (strain ATCC 1007 / CBS 513.65 / DSM 816 / NCTC 3887 / NRRL 1 / QM 1276 / 107) TaxID=344612 RepID=A1C5P8_ASPCL|nr:hypothetical protein ACLA_004300 [Aspergillus clavatus NRRL 1]